MNYSIKNGLGILMFLCLAAFSLTGCYESHYYDQHHHHSRRWYDRHHTPPPAGVDFNVDVHN